MTKEKAIMELIDKSQEIEALESCIKILEQERGSEAAKGRERFDRNGKVYRRGKEQGEIGETVELLTGIERPRHQGGSFKETDSKSRRI